MGIFEIILTAMGLSMDAFAVAMCKGLALKKVGAKEGLITGIWFGGFQALMPIIGYFLGSTFEGYIMQFDHWVAFILLSVIGGNMIKESLSDEEECSDNGLSVKSMFPMAIATSIDALAVGITFAFLKVNIAFSALLIGCITFILSAIGIKAGNIFGTKYKSKAELMGGIILIFLGIKILIEHLIG